MELKAEEIINSLKCPSQEDIELIKHALKFASNAHKEQKRYSGEDYIIHPFETAKKLAEMQTDAKTIVAGLLHDVCEDCLVTGETSETSEALIKKEFGEEILFLVEGVTKLGKLKYRGEERRIESLRKMFLAMAQDIRVVLIKLADRLHNLKTLEHIPEEKQKRIALETLEIYVPLANRLGMGHLKGDLEDLSFQFAYPKEYKEVNKMLKGKRDEKERKLILIKHEIADALKKNGITDFEMNSRVKRIYSLYQKLKKPEYGMEIDKIHDLIALRIIVDNVGDCYRALGIIHGKWAPVPGRFKDYIATPKPNGYQSLHTDIFINSGERLEIQIRSKKMNDEARYGIASHLAYEESDKPQTGGTIHPRLSWIKQLIDWQKEVADSKTFLEALKLDFFNDRVFCFTPKGDAVDLPEGATAVDFAYAVHSEIGNQAVGVIVNGKYVSLNTILKNRDIVEIRIQKGKKPNLDWLEFAKTAFAKRQIKFAHSKGIIFKKHN